MLLNKNTLILSLSMLLIFIMLPLWSAYLRNIPVGLKQPDGTQINLFASGDEYHNWLHDRDGYTIKQNDQGWYVYVERQGKELVFTTLIAGRDNPGQRNIAPWANVPAAEIGQKRLARANQIREIGGDRVPHSGTLNNIVVFIRFADQTEFGQNLSVYNSMFNGTGNTMQAYFSEASYNSLNISTTYYPATTTTVVSWQDSHIRGYYSPYNAATNPTGYQNDTAATNREHTLLVNAVNGVSAQIPTNLNIDADNDGNVDNVCFIIKGGTDAWADLLWPHRWSLYSQTVNINNKRVYDYNFQLSEFLASSGNGVLCHEMFHSLGSPDLYHYTDDGMTPVGGWDLMENTANPPQHMGAFMKSKYVGWIPTIPTISASQSYTLNPLTSSTGNAFRINSPNSTSEYFIVEFRKQTGTFESQIPGSGLLVYRINTVVGDGNADGPPDEVYIYRPGGTTTNDGTINNAFFSSQSGRTAINATTNPNPFLTNGSAGGLVLSNIGSSAGTTMTFNLVGNTLVTLTGTVVGSNAPTVGLAGATVTAGTVTATTNASGVYSLQIAAGAYTVTAAKAGYATGTQTGVVVSGASTTLNFSLTPSNDLVNESFDAVAFPPAGWTNAATNGTYTWDRITAGTYPVCQPHSGAGFARYNSYNATAGQGANLATIAFPAATGYTYSVSFWMYRDGGYSTNTDFVNIYTNGSPNTTGGVIIGTINRSTALEPVVSTDGWYNYTYNFTPVPTTGSSYLIFSAYSDYGNDMYIDDVVVSRSAANTVPFPAICVSPVNNATGVATSATLIWSSGGGNPTDYNVYFGTAANPPLVINQTATTYTPALVAGTTYYWKIVPHNAIGNAVNCPIWSFQTGTGTNIILMSNGSQTVANGTTYNFYDSGGAAGSYQINENFTFTFTAVSPTSTLQAVFSSFDTEVGYDFLKIYNGPNASSPQIGPATGYDGTTSPGTVSAGNALTFVFTSDVSINNAGWAAIVTALASAAVNITGTVVGSDAPTVGLAGAAITFMGGTTNTGTTNATGAFSITVPASSAYSYTITKAGYQNATGTVTVGTTNYSMGTVTLTEQQLPAVAIVATENAAHSQVNLSWMQPGSVGGDWIHWDSDLNNDGVGTGGVADFDVASRWPVADLTGHVGKSLYAVKFYPNAASCSYSIRVWTGGSATAPGTMVIDQAVTNPTIAAFNTVILSTPVPITAGQELWFGVRCNATSGYPAGCDPGPAHNGLGNMMYFQGAWTTLYNLAPTLDYDWNLSGYVGYSAPTRFLQHQPAALRFNSERVNIGTLAASGRINKLQSATVINNENEIRSLLGYKVWRLLAGQETNETAWTLLTPNSITATAYTDASWVSLNSGNYKWAVKALYTNNVPSAAAFSNSILKPVILGTLAGLVRTTANTPISGATVTAGTYTATTTATGAFTLQLPVGTYTVTAARTGYVTGSQTGVVIVSGQTTTVNFNLAAVTIGVSGTVLGSDAPTVGLANATVNLTGATNYSGTTNAAGLFSITGVQSGTTYAYTISKTGYQNATGNITVGIVNYSLGNVILNELILPVTAVLAAENANSTVVNLSWTAPNAAMRQGNATGLSEFTRGKSQVLNDIAFDNANDSRSLVGYKVWRLIVGQETNEAAWTLLTTNNITTLTYADAGWAAIAPGNYKWAVKAVYTNNLYAASALSNAVQKTNPIGTLAGTVRTAANTPLAGVVVTAGTYTATTSAAGSYSLQVAPGTYTVAATKAGYVTGSQNNVAVTAGQTTTLNFILADVLNPPANLTYSVIADDVTLNWTAPQPALNDADVRSFVTYKVYHNNILVTQTTALTYTDANLVNGNYSYYITALYDSGESIPTSTVTAIVAVAYPAQNVIAGMVTGTNDVAITWNAPQGGPTFNGYIVYFLLDSQQNTPASWVSVSPGTTETTITDTVHGGLAAGNFVWAVIAAYDDGNAPAAFSNVVVYTANDDDTQQAMTDLIGNYPNPFNPETRISFSLKATTDVQLLVYNTKGQLIKTLVRGRLDSGDHQILWKGDDDQGQPMCSGIYLYRLITPDYAKTGKAIMMK